MITLKEQLTEIVKNSKFYNEELKEDTDIVLGDIERFLNISVSEKCKEVLGE